MNPQIRLSQSVSGRPPQIINNAVVQHQGNSATTPGNMVVLRQPVVHATANPNTASNHGTTVRSLVVSQPSNRPIATNTAGPISANVQMYVTQQPVSILPRGGLIPANASATSAISQSQTAAGTTHSNSTIAVTANDTGAVAAGSGNARIISSTTVIRPKIEAVSSAGVLATTSSVTGSGARGSLNASDDPSQIQAQVMKCHNFLSCLIRFSGDSAEKRHRLIAIMQELIDAKITVLEFMHRVTDCLKSSSQLPQLRPFLEMVLPHLRREMYAGKIVFEEGDLRPPPLEALHARPQTVQTQQQIATTTVQRLPQQHHQHQQVIHAGPPVTPATPIRQPYGTVAIHSPAAGHQMTVGSQRPSTPSVTASGQRAIAVSGMQSQSLRALHPRPPPIMTVNAGPSLTQAQVQPPQQHHNLANSSTNSMTTTMNVVPHGASSVSAGGVPGAAAKRITPRTQASAAEDYEEYNDVAMMGGVNLSEESRNILPTVAAPATASSRTCKEQLFVPLSALKSRILKQSRGITNISDDALAVISHALEERMKNLLTHLSVAVEHRTTQYRDCPIFEQETDVRGQIKFLEEVDRAEKVRHDDEERAALIKAARSRSRNENTDHIKMKEKARLMMQKEYEMEKQREANITALAAIGPRKKRKFDTDFNQLSNDASSVRTPGNSGFGPGMGGSNKSDGLPAKRVIRRATMKDLMYVMEKDPALSRSQLMWKAIFK